jgi:hypothetical protein
MSRLFDRYDSADLSRLLDEAGVLASLRAKGFANFAVSIESAGVALPHVVLRADKGDRTHLLLETCLRRVTVAPALARARGFAAAAPLDLLLVHWMREQDPTALFAPGRPPLLLQQHPGLGVLRRAFRVAVRIAADLGVDGVASLPKFFHDAVIFHRSRLFLFLDGDEQGRFEALQRDLEALKLRDATIAVAGWCVDDQRGRRVRWQPGYQVFPLSPRLTAHFHSGDYASAVGAARARCRFRVDAAALAAAHALLDAAQPSPAADERRESGHGRAASSDDGREPEAPRADR